jgi:hypothetical protein
MTIEIILSTEDLDEFVTCLKDGVIIKLEIDDVMDDSVIWKVFIDKSKMKN